MCSYEENQAYDPTFGISDFQALRISCPSKKPPCFFGPCDCERSFFPEVWPKYGRTKPWAGLPGPSCQPVKAQDNQPHKQVVMNPKAITDSQMPLGRKWTESLARYAA